MSLKWQLSTDSSWEEENILSRARAPLCPFSVSICGLSTRVETAFESLPHVICFLGTYENSRPLHGNTEEKAAAAVPPRGGRVWPGSPAAGQLGAPPHPLQAHRHWVVALFLLCGNRESIEILVRPSFCLTPSHMVLSLVSYFPLYKISFSRGTKLAI